MEIELDAPADGDNELGELNLLEPIRGSGNRVGGRREAKRPIETRTVGPDHARYGMRGVGNGNLSSWDGPSTGIIDIAPSGAGRHLAAELDPA